MVEGVSADLQVLDEELYDQLRAQERELATLTERGELAKGKFKKFQE